MCGNFDREKNVQELDDLGPRDDGPLYLAVLSVKKKKKKGEAAGRQGS